MLYRWFNSQEGLEGSGRFPVYEGDWAVSCLELQGIREDRHRVKPEKHMVPIGNQMGRQTL